MPRYSLRTALLLTTIIALAISVVLLWRDAEFARGVARRLRGEVGQFTIDDQTRVNAIQVRQPDPNLWRWRVYLPPGRPYKLRQAVGPLPSRVGMKDKDWLTAVKNNQYGSLGEHSGSEMQGELVVEASLFRQTDGWRFVTRPGDDVSFFPLTSLGTWLDELSRIERGDVSKNAQRVFERHEPIILLHLVKPVLKPTAGGGTQSTEDTKPAEGIVVWLEE